MGVSLSEFWVINSHFIEPVFVDTKFFEDQIRLGEFNAFSAIYATLL
jgi:hypothetical protein